MHFGLTNGTKPHSERRKICPLRYWRFASLARPDTWSFGRRGHAPSRIATPLPPKALPSGRKACRILEHVPVSVPLGAGEWIHSAAACPSQPELVPRAWALWALGVTSRTISRFPTPAVPVLAPSKPGRSHGTGRGLQR